MLAAQQETGIRHTALRDGDRRLPGGLGRFEAKDPRDQLHPFASVLRKRITAIVTKTWATLAALDQGATSRCVAFAWVQWLSALPIRTRARVRVDEFLNWLYARAQDVDEWPGNAYNGTSVRAGAKVLMEAGHIVEYVWGTTVEEVKQFILQRGTVVFGSDWYEEMFFPADHGGYLVLEGPSVGGHAYLIIGYNATKKAFRVLNSWGPEWGDKGKAWIAEATVAQLLLSGAEACSAIEKKVPRKKTA